MTPTALVSRILVLAAIAPAQFALAIPFPNVARTPGELISGPISPEQGRTAIIAFHGDRIITVPEAPGSQGGADNLVRLYDVSDPASPQVTVFPFRATGFHAHAYFHSGNDLYIGPHCVSGDGSLCDGSDDHWVNSFRIGGSGPAILGSGLTHADIEDTGLLVGGINRSGTQSPWGVEDFWSYSPVGGNSFIAVRRGPGQYIYDWANGGARTGPAILHSWDHLGQTGVVGFPFIMGNILVYAADMTGTGVCTYDISDPTNPILLDVLKEENPGGYWPEVYGHYVFFPRRDNEGGPGSQAGFMVVDFSDPTDLKVVADRNLPGSNQYVTFQDEYAFMNNYKIDMRTFEVELTLATNDVTLDASQFALPVGNLVFTGGYGTLGPGMAIWAHQAEPDTRSPYVLYHVPTAGQTNFSTVCPITLSIPETLRTETIVDGVSLIVRPLGGDPVPTWHSFGQGKLLTVTPQSPLAQNTTYEVLLTAAIQDAMGNPLEAYSFTFSTGASLGAGNQPPMVGAVIASPEVAQPGASVALSWSGSDPEGGAVEYRVDFGDGTARTDWGAATSANHVYTAAGHYQVTVQVRDAQGSLNAVSRTISVLTPPANPGATRSSMITIDSVSGTVYTANPDARTVTAVVTATNAILWESAVGKHPMSVALPGDGTLWVASSESDELHVLNAATGALIATMGTGYGSRPVAVAALPNGSALLVSCEGDGTLRRFDATTRVQTHSVVLGPYPRAIAITHDGTRALITRFISGEHQGSVYDVALGTMTLTLTRTIRLARSHTVDSSAGGRGVPNYLAGINISPDGEWAWIVGKKDNTERGTFSAPNQALSQDNTVRAMMMLVNLASGAEDTSYRLDIDNSDSPTAIDFSPLGDYAFISLQGNAQVAVLDVLDFFNPSDPGTISTRWQTGLAPQGLVVDPSTSRVYTADFMDRTITVLGADAFIVSGNGNVASQAIPVVARELLHDEVLLGKQIFYHASDPRMSAEGYMSCATCHVAGGHDGRTWDFTNRGEGFRNTADLRGRSGTWHGNVHWSANFDEIQDFENDIRNGFGGEGFLQDSDWASLMDTLGAPKAGHSEDLDALAAYVASLGTSHLPRSPHRQSDGSLSAAALAGQALFAANNCASCHSPATDFTDRTMHDVGTMNVASGSRLGATLTGIDTPTLLGLHDSAPYLHNGSATTLEEVFTTAGGLLVQAEDATSSSAVSVETVDWAPMKEWHQGAFVGFDELGILNFEGIVSSTAGTGYVDVRYSMSYATGNFGVRIGANTNTAAFPMTGNNPSYLPNEWRIARFPIAFAAGTNTVTVLKNGPSGGLSVDEVRIVTPDHLAAAGAHVRGFTTEELANLTAYLRSLDGSDAGLPAVTITRNATPLAGFSDTVTIPGAADEVTAVYTIENSGFGPLNIGQLRFAGGVPAVIAAHPRPTILPGESTELTITIPSSLAGQTLELSGWTDVPGMTSLSMSIQVAQDASVGEIWMVF
ncbi:PKD domain-containing protein [bacterium]|nr:PKD domain-containing protein [bacterium]